ncbi:MAG TPA: hypothetical protein VGM92_05465 [Candidatus Kapabacteria bacterium]|jgi:hypothetical protein
MERYYDLSGKSGVAGYEIHSDGIWVQFKNGNSYFYSRVLIGESNFSQMRDKAIAGKGLATLIATHPVIREGYSQKR